MDKEIQYVHHKKLFYHVAVRIEEVKFKYGKMMMFSILIFLYYSTIYTVYLIHFIFQIFHYVNIGGEVG